MEHGEHREALGDPAGTTENKVNTRIEHESGCPNALRKYNTPDVAQPALHNM